MSIPILNLSNQNQMTASALRARPLDRESGAAMGRLALRLNQRLSRAPRISVIGEFNAGKSTLINALIGANVVPTGFDATTRTPIRVYHAVKPSLVIEMANREKHEIAADQLEPSMLERASLLHVGLPMAKLQSFELVDTPGLQSGESWLCERAMDACRQSHVAIWCTTAMQAWKASEASAWQSLPKRLRANGILAVTFKDSIQSADDEARLLGRLKAEAGPHFNRIVAVSARDAIGARTLTDAPRSDKMWHLSGAGELGDAIDNIVSALLVERLRGAERLLNTAIIETRRGPALAS